jgi:hypothetical protein
MIQSVELLQQRRHFIPSQPLTGLDGNATSHGLQQALKHSFRCRGACPLAASSYEI